MLKTYQFALSDQKHIERIIDDENVVLNHMIIPSQESVPEHYTNSNVYMIIVGGEMNIKLNDELSLCKKGTILNIPYKTKMNITNEQRETLEFFVVKAPNPKDIN